MEPAFWDASALVPLCVQQNATQRAQSLSRRYEVVIWWVAPVEICGAFARLVRMGQLTSNGQVLAQVVLTELRSKWREILPDPFLRDQAEQLLDRFPLKAADALQLAAALAWCSGKPRARAFISGDTQLLDAAQQLGFQALGI
jgi:predicted nucleic acid-binding protein